MKKYRIAGGGNKDFTLDELKYFIKKRNYMPVHNSIVKELSGKKILDLGCNIGNYSHAAAECYPSSTVIGVDYKDNLIEMARALYPDTSNLSFDVMSAMDLKFADNEFDCVCFLEVIEHLDDPVKALKEIYRVLKLGGTLILSTNNVYYSRFFGRQIMCDILRKKPRLMIHEPSLQWGTHLFAWDLSTLATLLHVSGFDHSLHFYIGRSGFYFRDTAFDKCIDAIFSKLFPFLRATVVIKATRR
jgi:ubiquinone/menaquinone biosynthesis C-methylase UbiE